MRSLIQSSGLQGIKASIYQAFTIDSEVLPSLFDQEDDDEEDLDQKKSNIKAVQKSQKETHDRKHQPQVLPKGTEVLQENIYQKQRKGGKMEPLWLGPYTIHRNLGTGQAV